VTLDALLMNLILGITNSGLYLFVALGLTILFGVMRGINVAHGNIVVLGGYTALIVTGLGMPPLLGLVSAILVCAVIGYSIDKLLAAPLRSGELHVPGEAFLLLTLGLSWVIENITLGIAGPYYRTNPPFIEGNMVILNTSLPTQRVLILVVTLLVIVGLFLFLKFAKFGNAIRAVSQNPNAAKAVGINVERVHHLTFALSAALAGAAGSMITSLIYVQPSIGFSWTVKAFVVIILGGLGNVLATFFASFIFGITESIAVMFIPSQFKALVGVLIMVIVLIFKPTGLFGKSRSGIEKEQ